MMSHAINVRHYCEVVVLLFGGTTTVVLFGGGEPDPMLELHAANAIRASSVMVGIVLI